VSRQIKLAAALAHFLYGLRGTLGIPQQSAVAGIPLSSEQTIIKAVASHCF